MKAKESSLNSMYLENHPREDWGLRIWRWRWCTKMKGGQWKPILASSGFPPCSVRIFVPISPIFSTMGRSLYVRALGSLQEYSVRVWEKGSSSTDQCAHHYNPRKMT